MYQQTLERDSIAFEDTDPRSIPLDRREWVRYPSNLEAICWFPHDDEGEPWLAFVNDIAAGGVGLRCKLSLTPGTQYRLKLHCERVNLTGSLSVKVITVKASAPGEWLLGCQFTRPLTDSERRLLL